MRDGLGLVALGGGLPSSTASTFALPLPLSSCVPSSSGIGRRLSEDREYAKVFCSRPARVFSGDLKEDGTTSSSRVSPRGRFCSAERIRFRKLSPWRCRSRRFYDVSLATGMIVQHVTCSVHRDTAMAALVLQVRHQRVGGRLGPFCHECAPGKLSRGADGWADVMNMPIGCLDMIDGGQIRRGNVLGILGVALALMPLEEEAGCGETRRYPSPNPDIFFG